MTEWTFIDGEDTRFDPLLDGLMLLCKLYKTPMNRDALSAGLPVNDGRLDPKSFVLAAGRAGLQARLHEKKLDSISALTFPSLVLLDDRQVAILLEKKGDKFKVMRPEYGFSQEWVSQQALGLQYSGYVFLIKQKYQFDGRKDRTLDLKVDHWFWGTLAKCSKIYRDVLVASVVINLIILAVPLYSRNVYDRVIPNEAMTTLWTFTAGIALAFLFDMTMRLVRAYFLDLAGKKSDVMLNAIIFEKVQNAELSERPRSVGSFAKELQDFDSIRDLITSGSMALIIDLPFTVIFLMVIYLMGDHLVFVPLVAMAFLLTLSVYCHFKIKYCVEQSSRASVEKNGLLVEVLQAPEVVRAYNMQSRNQKKYEDATAAASDWSLKSKFYSTMVGTLSNSVQQIATVATVVLGVYLIHDAKLTMGGLIAVSMLLGRTIAPMAQVAGLITRINGAQIAYQSLAKLMNSPSEIDYTKHYKPWNHLRGNFEFKGVSFAYPEAPVMALHDVSFKVQAGDRIGVLGKIGCGKSTIGKLLLRLYEPTEGSVLVDGVDMKQVNPYDLRHHIGYVPQQVQLFFGTLKDNITWGASWVDDERIERVAKLAGVTDFSDAHPDGLNMLVAEGGVNLSGGQRQLVALARALLLSPSILILDEPSASMDQTTESVLLRRLEGVSVGRTLIIFTHKPALLSIVDKIMVIESGQLVAYDEKNKVFEQLKQASQQVAGGGAA